MPHSRLFKVVSLPFMCVILATGGLAAEPRRRRARRGGAPEFVNLLIGPGKGRTESARRYGKGWNEAFGANAPLVGTPNAMTHWSAETQRSVSKCIAPFYYGEPVTGFRLSHWLSGSCTQDYGSVTVVPVALDSIGGGGGAETPEEFELSLRK